MDMFLLIAHVTPNRNDEVLLLWEMLFWVTLQYKYKPIFL